MKSYRRRSSDHVNHDRWLVSYADFITLMFAFFVVMFASARMDQKKAARLSSAIDTAFQELGGLKTESHPPVTGLPQITSPGAANTSVPANLGRTASQQIAPGDDALAPQDVSAIRKELERALAPEIQRQENCLTCASRRADREPARDRLLRKRISDDQARFR